MKKLVIIFFLIFSFNFCHTEEIKTIYDFKDKFVWAIKKENKKYGNIKLNKLEKLKIKDIKLLKEKVTEKLPFSEKEHTYLKNITDPDFEIIFLKENNTEFTIKIISLSILLYKIRLAVLTKNDIEYNELLRKFPNELINDINSFKQSLESCFTFEDPFFKGKEWSKKVWDAIKEDKIFIGMTSEQVKLSWGKPEKINKDVGKWGVHEQWIYSIDQYLYFENDKLTSIQQSE